MISAKSKLHAYLAKAAQRDAKEKQTKCSGCKVAQVETLQQNEA